MRCQGVSLQPLRRYSLHLAIIWRGERFQHFSDISRFLTFMVKSPQTCLSSNLQCADMQVYELHTYTDLCQRCGLVLNDCKHTPVWNYVLLMSTIWEMARRAKCAASSCMHFLLHRPTNCILSQWNLKKKVFPLKWSVLCYKNITFYLWIHISWIN